MQEKIYFLMQLFIYSVILDKLQMDAVNRRILVWNEPMCESSEFEDVKLLFGGDTMKVKVNYLGDAVVDRTPVIVLTNSDVFPRDSTLSFVSSGSRQRTL